MATPMETHLESLHEVFALWANPSVTYEPITITTLTPTSLPQSLATALDDPVRLLYSFLSHLFVEGVSRTFSVRSTFCTSLSVVFNPPPKRGGYKTRRGVIGFFGINLFLEAFVGSSSPRTQSKNYIQMNSFIF